jgi:Domain of unknown function (DUF4396)
MRHAHERAGTGGSATIDYNTHAASSAELNRLAAAATNHCLSGCVIGEVIGMAIATALGWGNVASIVLAVALAVLFGYSLTSLPLLPARLPLGTIVPIALAADTVSIAIMELIDNGFVLLVPERWKRDSATSAFGRRCWAVSSLPGPSPSPSTG